MEEQQYLQLIRDILSKGHNEVSRNGNVRSLFGYSMRFSLQDGQLPLLTTKRVAWKTCFHELCWFIRGSTNNKELQEKKNTTMTINVHQRNQRTSHKINRDHRKPHKIKENRRQSKKTHKSKQNPRTPTAIYKNKRKSVEVQENNTTSKNITGNQ